MILIIVLGNKLKTCQIHKELKGRMDIAIQLFFSFINHEELLLILSGGVTNPKISFSEAEIMYKYAIKKKVPKNKIIKEENALDTIGNAFFTRKIVDRLENISKIFVVTSCYHVNRAKFIFEMCYGKKYEIDFNFCYQTNVDEAYEKEKYEKAKEFFGDISPGDIEKIRKRLLTFHNLYRK